MGVSGQLHSQGKSPWYPLGRKLGGAQSLSGHSGEEANKMYKLIVELVPLPYFKLKTNYKIYRLVISLSYFIFLASSVIIVIRLLAW